MSTARARKRVEDEAAAEEPWAVQSYDWDPVSLVAHKKRVVASGPTDVPVATATAYRAELGFGPSDAVVEAAAYNSMQYQLAADPKLASLPVLETVDRADAEPATHCEVVGCGVSLAGLKRYYVRMRVCEQHLHTPAIVVNGVISRFCQQCAKFQFVGEFSGSKKSCAATLERHNARHRAKVLARLQEQQDVDSDSKPGPTRGRAMNKGVKRQNSTKPARADSDAVAAAIAAAAAAAATAAAAAAPTSSSDTSGWAPANGLAFPGTAGQAACGDLRYRPDAATYIAGPGPDPGQATPPTLVYPKPQNSGGLASADGIMPANPGSPLDHALVAWDGATSAGMGGLPPRPLVTTGGNGVVSMGDYPPPQAASGSMGSYLPPQQQAQQPSLMAPSLLQPNEARPPGQWTTGGGSGGSVAGWEPYNPQQSASGQGIGLNTVSYDVRGALGAMQGHLLREVQMFAGAPPAVAGLAPQPGPTVGNPAKAPYNMAGYNHGSAGMPRFAPSGAATPRSALAAEGATGSRGSTPGAVHSGAATGYIGGMASNGAWHATTRQASVASGRSDGEGRASRHDGLRGAGGAGGGAGTPCVQTQSGDEPCGSSGGNGGCGGVQAASPACSLNEGVSATRVSGSGITAADNGKGGESGGTTGVAARINTIMEELCPLIEQFKQEVTQGGWAPANPQDTAFRAAGYGASNFRYDPAGDSSAAGFVPRTASASWSGMRGSSGLSGPSPPASAGVPLQDRAGSNSLPPLPNSVGNAVALVRQASSQLAAALQPPTAGTGAPAAQQWTVTSGAPEGPLAGPGMQPLPPQQQPTYMQGLLQGIKQEPRSQSPRSALNPFAISAQSRQSTAQQDPQHPLAAPPPGWRPLSTYPGVMVNMGQAQPQPQPVHAYSAAAHASYPGPQAGASLPDASSRNGPPSSYPATGGVPAGPNSAFGDPAGQPGYARAEVAPAAGGAQSGQVGGDEDASGDDDLMKQLLSYLEEPEEFIPTLQPTAPQQQHTGMAQPPQQAAQYQHLPQHAPHVAQQHPQHHLYQGFTLSVQHAVATQQQAVHSMPYGSRASPFTAWNAGGAPQAPPYAQAQPHPHLQHPHGAPMPAAAAAPPAPAYHPGTGGAVYGTSASLSPPPNYPRVPGPAGWGTMAPPPSQLAAGADLQDIDDVDPREFTRVSLKAMNVLPHELPANLRSNLRRWLKEARAEALQATLRPGCLQLVVDVRRLLPSAADGAAGVAPDLASLLIPSHDAEQAAVDVFRILGQRLRDTYVQVDQRVLQIRVGERPVVLNWEEAAEDGGLDGAKYPFVKSCSAAAVCAGSEAALELQGAHLAHARTKAFARLRGHDLPASLLPASATATSAADGGYSLRMSVAVPSGAVGLMVVEVGVGHLLGDWWPVLVLPWGQEDAAEEVRRLQTQAEAGGQAVDAEDAAPQARQERFRRFVMTLASVLEVLHDAITSAAASADAAAVAAQPAGSPRGTAADTGGRRSSSPDYGASRSSQSDAGTTTGWTYTGGIDTMTSTGIGSTLASLATSSASVLGPMLAAAGGGQHAAQHFLAAAASAGGARPASAGTAVPAPPAATTRQALSRTARLLRYAIAKGLPNLTGLLLAAADGLVHFLEVPQTAACTSGPAADVHASHPAQAQRGRTGLLVAAGVDPQALLPLAVISGDAATVDRLAAFAAGVMGSPLRWDLPQGPHGMSLLHMAALLPDGGALASHVVATQPWAAWEWLSLGWRPPKGKAEAAAVPQQPLIAPAAVSNGHGCLGEAGEFTACNGNDHKHGSQSEDEVQGDDDEEDEEDEEMAAEGSLPPAAVRLTPAFMSLLLGQKDPVHRAVAALTARPVAAAAPPAASLDNGLAVATLLEAVEAWGRSGCSLLSLLCEQLARQRL